MRATARSIGSLLIAAAMVPLPSAAQVSPTSPPHPAMPWVGITTPQGQLLRYIQMPPQDVTLEYLVFAPPASTEAPSPAPGDAAAEPKSEGGAPGGAPGGPATATPGGGRQAAGEPKAQGAAEPETPAPGERPVPGRPLVLRQVVTIPGYVVRETTVGYHYPERWVIEQFGPNAYRWRMLPAQFVPK